MTWNTAVATPAVRNTVIDLEDLGGGISIADLTLNDFRIDLAGFLQDNLAVLERLPFGTFAATTTRGLVKPPFPPGVIFCLRAVGDLHSKPSNPATARATLPCACGDDGTVLLPYTQAKQALDRLKKLCGKPTPPLAPLRLITFSREHGRRAEATGSGRRRHHREEGGTRVRSLFTQAAPRRPKGEFAGISDFGWLLSRYPRRSGRMNPAGGLSPPLSSPPRSRSSGCACRPALLPRLFMEQGAHRAADKRQIRMASRRSCGSPQAQ